MERMLQWESVNELHAFRLLDCDPGVTAFHEQPCEIVYLDGTETRHHYPDIYVEVNGNREFWEIKTESEASQSRVSARTGLLVQQLPTYGFTYRLVLDRELAQQPRLENANTLLRFGRRPTRACERELVRMVLESKGHLSWSEACQGALGAHGREILCRLVLEGRIRFDTNSSLCATTQFIWKEE